MLRSIVSVIVLFILGTSLVVVATRVPEYPRLNAEEKAWIAEYQTIRIGLRGSSEDASRATNTNDSAWAADLLRLAALKTGIDLNFVPMPSIAVANQLLKEGKVDLVAPFGARPDLAAFADRSLALAWLDRVFVTSEAHPEIRNISDIHGRVGLINGTDMAEYQLTQFPHLEHVPTADILESIQLLVSGEIHAFLGAMVHAGAETGFYKDNGLRVIGEPVVTLPVHAWALKTHPIPLQIINKGLAAITDAESSLVFVKSLGLDLTQNNPNIIRLPNWAKMGLTAVAIAIFITVIFILILRRQVSQATLELNLLNRDLNTIVKERTAELSEKSLDLQEANRNLENFAFAASHDLRGPLATMRNFLADLRQNLAAGDDAENRESLDFIQQSIERLSTRVNAFLMLSKSQRLNLVIEPIELDSLLKQVIRDLHSRIEQERATIAWRDLGILEGDRQLIGIVFQALIQNSLNNRSDRPPFIEITRTDNAEETIITVSDNGIGFTPSEKEEIFTMFKRLSHGSAGSGIGLGTCRMIMDRLGGKISAEGSPDAGATFTLSWPKTGMMKNQE